MDIFTNLCAPCHSDCEDLACTSGSSNNNNANLCTKCKDSNKFLNGNL